MFEIVNNILIEFVKKFLDWCYAFMLGCKRKGWKLLGSFFVTYAVVLIIPIALAALCYNEALSIVQRDIEYENQALLAQAGEVLDTRSDEMQNIGMQLVSSPQVLSLRYISSPFEYPNTSKIISERDTMQKYVLNDFVFDYLLYFNNGRFVMNDKSIYSYDDFYKLYMHPVEQSYDEWLDATLNAFTEFGEWTARTVNYMRGGDKKLLDLIEFSYSFIAHDNNDGRVVLYVEKEKLLELVSRVNMSNEGSLFIENAKGELLAAQLTNGVDVTALQTSLEGMDGYCVSAQRNVDGKDMFITHVTSQKTGLRIAVALPDSLVFARLTSLKTIIIWLLGLAILLGSAISYPALLYTESALSNRWVHESLSLTMHQCPALCLGMCALWRHIPRN